MKLTGAQILVEELVNQGVDTIFGYPGGQVLNIYDELYKNAHRIRHVLTAHEQGAVHAADGYARVMDRPGVVIATSGPGATNLVTGIANAYLDSVPLIAITGNVSTSLLGRDSFQEVDIVGITQPIVKHNYIVRDVKNLEQTLKEAFVIANTGRKGPVLIDIPKSVQVSEADYSNNVKICVKSSEARRTCDLTTAINAIAESKKPFIYCGGGVISAGAQEQIIELSKKLSAPIGLSMMGISAIPYSYDLNLGMCGMHGRYASSAAQAEADLIIAAGVRFSDRATGNTSEYTKGCTVIHIDIDASEIGKNVSPQIGLCGDIKEVLTQLLSRIPERKNQEWLDMVTKFKEKEAVEPNDEFTPRNIIGLINSSFAKDTVVATDVGQHQMWTIQYYKFEQPRRLLTSGGLGTMGFGMGAAIGGCIANGRKPTVLITSDGSFGMNLTELATAVSQELPLVIVLLNNGVLGMVRQWQTLFYDKRYSQTTLQRKTDFPLLARAFGAEGYAAESLADLEDIVGNRLNRKGPCLIDCKINIDEKVLPFIPPGGSIKDIVLH
ncbi:MAG: biosynthetic-type acetolactate synthase large subunit [Clostridiales bacterium]|jgi:acetolactate synthase-1/2/3 large subunit|nr:biosynthetic-type acetolactate synthase large subunit [Clostridiales bacterium]